MDDETTDSMVRVHLFASLQRAGIRIAEEQRTVHGVARDQAHDDAVRKREVGRRLDMLRGVDLFSVLSEDEMNEIAERLQYAPFARGDVITKQGNIPHWLYIVAFGEVEVRYEPPHGAPQTISTLRSGQFFGEMALLTGETRTATVVALTDVECYRLDGKSFQGLLLRARRSRTPWPASSTRASPTWRKSATRSPASRASRSCSRPTSWRGSAASLA